MWLHMDATGEGPVGRRIYRQIKEQILRGELKAGETVPSSRALSKELGVARNTVLEAYEQLTAEGYLETRPGSGTAITAGIEVLLGQGTASQESSIGRIPEGQPSEGMISFRSGIPALEHFPLKEWLRCYQRASERLPASGFAYNNPLGVPELRNALADYLVRSRGIRVTPERIAVTSGATQGLWLAARVLRGKGKAVLVEDPAHRGLTEVLQRAGYEARGVPVDDEGMDTSRLPDTDGARDLAFAYCTPSHQFPLGGILPVRRRMELLRFARELGIYVVEDDYDSEFRYAGAPVSAMFELDRERVVYLGSFSKILAPALRLGFAILPEELVQSWRAEKKYTDVHTDALSQYALAEFMTSGGLERHLWRMKKLYRRRREELLQGLQRHFGSGFAVRGHAAGLHMVVSFNGVSFTNDLVAKLQQGGVTVIPLESYALHPSGQYIHSIVMGYAHLTAEAMDRGLGLLKTVISG